MGRHLSVRAGRDDWQNTAQQHAFAKAIPTIALVCEQRLGRGDHDGYQVIGGCIIRRFTAGQDEADRQSLIVAAGVDFACKAAA